jgi:hypothetical protein
MAIKQSGTNRTPAERAAGGRPNKLFPLTTEVDETIGELATQAGVSRAMVVSAAVVALAARRAQDPDGVDAELRAYAAEDKRRTAEKRKKTDVP